MNVCELDIIFNFQQAYTIIDEILLGGKKKNEGEREIMAVRYTIFYIFQLLLGELQESSKRSVLNSLKKIEDAEKDDELKNAALR